MVSRIACALLLVTVGVASVRDTYARAKTDVVGLNNGDRITCEIKELSRGKLTVSTDAMSTIAIEWDDIAALESKYYFRVEVSDGRRFYGSILIREGDRNLIVISPQVSLTFVVEDVVAIIPIEQGFWGRQDGSVSIGYSFTKASNVAQLTFDWTNIYRTERNRFDISAKTILTDKRNEETTATRIDYSLTYIRLLLRQGWSGQVNAAYQRNDELGLKRRWIGGLSAGLNAIRSNHNQLIVTAGLAFNSELSTGDGGTTESLEAALAASYSLFVYNTPKSDITASVEVYPSLTESKRYRIELDIKARKEIIKDLFLDVSYYESFDSSAPTGEGKKRDYGIVTSVGYTY